MINLTLKQMRYFDALARQGHFGRAADACAISQPALSMQIQEMERTLGTPLLERGARGVSLTPFGEDVLARLRDVLRIVGEIEDTARAARDRLAGRIRLGVIPTVAPYVLPQHRRASLAERYPRVSTCNCAKRVTTSRLIDELAEGNLDAADPRPARRAKPRSRRFPLFTESFVLVRPGAERGNCPCPVPARDCAKCDSCCWRKVTAFAIRPCLFATWQPRAPREMMDGSSLSTLVQMVGAGLGVSR
jgi:LysR family hydrogen peroxide-inducible transcriptional activator